MAGPTEIKLEYFLDGLRQGIRSLTQAYDGSVCRLTFVKSDVQGEPKIG